MPARRHNLALLGAVGLSLLAWAPSSDAKPFNPTLAVTSTDYGAGAHATVDVQIEKQGQFAEQGMKTIELWPPRGFFSTDNGGTYCDLRQLGDEYFCANAAAQVGKASYEVTIDTDPDPDAVNPLNLTLSGDTFIERPQEGELARLVTLIEDLPSEPFVSPVRLSSGGDRLDIEIGEMPTMAELSGQTFAMDIWRLGMTLWGTNPALGGSPPLTFNPTFCDSANGFAAQIASYGENDQADSDDQTAQLDAAYPVTGCESRAFAPTLDSALSTTTAGAPTSLGSTVELGSASATIASSTTTIPADFLLNPDHPLASCPSEQFKAATCDAASKVGTVSASSPLTASQVEGDLHLGPADGGGLLLGIFVKEPFVFRMDGRLDQSADAKTLLMSFSYPPMPLSRVSVALADGLLLNPFKCGSYASSSSFVSHSGKSASATDAMQIDGCSGDPYRKPELEAWLSTLRPRRYADLFLKVTKDGRDQVQAAAFRLPRQVGLRLAGKPARGNRIGLLEAWDERNRSYRGYLRVAGRKGRAALVLTSKSRRLKGLKALLVRSGNRSSIRLSGLPETAAIDELSFTLFGTQSHLVRISPRVRTAQGCPRKLAFKATLYLADRQSRGLSDLVSRPCRKG